MGEFSSLELNESKRSPKGEWMGINSEEVNHIGIIVFFLLTAGIEL